MSSSSVSFDETTRRRDRVAMILMIIAAIGAFFAFIGAVGAASAAGPETRIVETWRMLGFVVFSGLFLLLAFRPRLLPGVWELAIFHKAGMAIAGMLMISQGAVDAASVAVADGTLAVVLVAAYLLARGYSAWEHLSST